jgi:Tetratricopeptide repeat
LLQAVHMAETIGVSSGAAESAYGNLALFYHYFLADYTKAEGAYLRTLQIMAHIQGPRTCEIGNTLVSLADVQVKQRKYDAASASLADYASIIREQRGSSHPETAQAYTLLAAHMRLLDEERHARSEKQ